MNISATILLAFGMSMDMPKARRIVAEMFMIAS